MKARREVCPAHGLDVKLTKIDVRTWGGEDMSQMLNSSLNVGVGVDQKEEPTRRGEKRVL